MDEFEEKPVEKKTRGKSKVFDGGVTIDDAKAIKRSLLIASENGVVEPGDFYTLASDMCAAFRFVDDEVFQRAEQEKKLVDKFKRKQGRQRFKATLTTVS